MVCMDDVHDRIRDLLLSTPPAVFIIWKTDVELC